MVDLCLALKWIGTTLLCMQLMVPLPLVQASTVTVTPAVVIIMIILLVVVVDGHWHTVVTGIMIVMTPGVVVAALD